MTIEDRVLLLCARQHMEPARCDRVRSLGQQPLDWERLYECALANDVALLVGTNLLKCVPAQEVPTAFTARLKQTRSRAIATKVELERVLRRVGERFPQEDFMLVKGAALDRLVYHAPWSVRSHDVDLVFRRRREEFGEAEYAALAAYFETLNQTIRLFDQNIEYEFFEHHDLTMNRVLPINFDAVWRDAVPLALGDRSVYVPAPLDLLLFACVNACRKRYFHVKALCDIAEIVAKYPALDWELFGSRARAYHCNWIAYAALRMTQQTVELALPPNALFQLGVSAPRQQYIESVMGLLIRRGSLDALSRHRGAEIFGRKLGWSLLLTYATYRWDQLTPKWSEIQTGRKSVSA